MSVANIVVHLDSGSSWRMRLALAKSLAQICHARLTGVFAETSGGRLLSARRVASNPDHAADSESARSAFTEATAGLGDCCDFFDIVVGDLEERVARIADIAGQSDFVIFGERDQTLPGSIDLAEHLILMGAPPVLVIPGRGGFGLPGESQVMAWRGSRTPIARKFNFLSRIFSGSGALTDERQNPDASVHEGLEIAIAHLTSCRENARYRRIVLGERELIDVICSSRNSPCAARLSPYDAFDFAEFSLMGRDSGTRYILRNIDLPVLFLQ